MNTRLLAGNLERNEDLRSTSSSSTLEMSAVDVKPAPPSSGTSLKFAFWDNSAAERDGTPVIMLKNQERINDTDRMHPTSGMTNTGSCPEEVELPQLSGNSFPPATRNSPQKDGTKSSRASMPTYKSDHLSVHPAIQYPVKLQETNTSNFPSMRATSYAAFEPNRLPAQQSPLHLFPSDPSSQTPSTYGSVETRPTNQLRLESVHSLQQLADQRMVSIPHKTPQMNTFHPTLWVREEGAEQKDADDSTFEKLVRITEGCTEEGDPFSPTPLGPGAHFREL